MSEYPKALYKDGKFRDLSLSVQDEAEEKEAKKQGFLPLKNIDQFVLSTDEQPQE
ncbi:MAG: hypothetical protein WC505_07940 [Patescibacteria group bacterium]